jgi:hypothetical protein
MQFSSKHPKSETTRPARLGDGEFTVGRQVWAALDQLRWSWVVLVERTTPTPTRFLPIAVSAFRDFTAPQASRGEVAAFSGADLIEILGAQLPIDGVIGSETPQNPRL